MTAWCHEPCTTCLYIQKKTCIHPKLFLQSFEIIWPPLPGCGWWQPKIVQNPRIDCQYIAKFFALQSNPQINCQYITNFSALHSASVQRSLCRNNIKLSNWIALTEAWGIFKVREDLLCYLWLARVPARPCARISFPPSSPLSPLSPFPSSPLSFPSPLITPVTLVTFLPSLRL